MSIKNGIFRPEFLNRFEGVIFFHPLSENKFLKVTEKLLTKLREARSRLKKISVFSLIRKSLKKSLKGVSIRSLARGRFIAILKTKSATIS